MGRKYTAILVEDVAEMRDDLRAMITDGHRNITLIGEAGNVPDAADLIAAQPPDLLFLDVELGSRSGFDLLERIAPVTMPVIFTTGSTAHMKDAIDLHLPYCAYLTKPVLTRHLDREIKQALDWLEARAPKHPSPAPHGMEVSGRRIGLPDGNSLVMVHLDDILYCVSDDPGTRVHLKTTADAKKPDPRPLFVAKGIGKFREALEPHGFGSPSQSAVVNNKYVAKVASIGEGGDVHMTDGTRHTVSKRSKKDFFALFDRID